MVNNVMFIAQKALTTITSLLGESNATLVACMFELSVYFKYNRRYSIYRAE